MTRSAANSPGGEVLLEGETFLESYEPHRAGFATAETKSRVLRVEDGILNVDLAHHSEVPEISAIEVEPVK